MLETYPKDVKVVFKNFPLRNHKFAMPAAMAAMAAHSEGKFWEVHDRLFENVSQLSDAKIQEIIETTGLNSDAFQKKLKSPKIRAKISQDQRDGNVAGVGGTPTVFVNGRRVRKPSIEAFSRLIEKALAEERKPK